MGTGVSCVGERVYIIARKQGKDGGIGRGQRMLAGVSPGVPMRPRRAKRGRGTECYLDHLARSQSCECCICTRHAITGCVWAVSSANTSYSFVDKKRL